MEFLFPHPEPGLSIVLPAYHEEENVGEAIAACLETVPGITSLPFEVVVVNDGSRDKTGEIIDDLAAGTPRCAPSIIPAIWAMARLSSRAFIIPAIVPFFH